MTGDRYRSILMTAPIGYAYHRVIVDKNNNPVDYVFEETNAFFHEITGLKAVEVIGRRVTEVIPDLVMDPFDWIRFLGEAALGKGEKEFEQYSGPLGKWIHVRVYAPEAGTIITFLSDVTDRLKEEESLRESELRFRQLAENLDVVFWVRTPEEMLYINPAYEKIWGRSREELYLNPHAFIESIHPEDREYILTKLQMEFEETGVFDETYRIIRPDQSKRWIKVRSFPVYDANHRLVRSAGIAEDITDQVHPQEQMKEYTEKLRMANREMDLALKKALEASRLKGAFLATVSHEIRTPMNAIVGLSHLAMDRSRDQIVNEYLQKIQHSSRRLLGIINDILDYSKIEAGKMTIERQTMSIKQILEETTELFVHRIRQKGLLMHVVLDPSLPPYVTGDPLRLRQILMNLISNALKFTQNGGIAVRVSVEAESRHGATLLFEVEDTGIGIPEGQIQRLFQPFIQAEDSLNRSYEGMGLGLSISRQLVEMMGGSIWVTSREKEGSCFSFRLPMDVEGLPAEAAPSSDADQEQQGSDPDTLLPTSGGVQAKKPFHKERFRQLSTKLDQMLAANQFIDEDLVEEMATLAANRPALDGLVKKMQKQMNGFQYDEARQTLVETRLQADQLGSGGE